MNTANASPLNLLALPPLQRKIMVHLAREGSADATHLAAALNEDPVTIEQQLAELAAKGSIQLSADGLAGANLGRTRRRTLPARLWPALLASSRLYTTQEIATLNTAVPILQFARAKMSEFADHGPGHVLRVKSFATQLASVVDLSRSEQHLLRAACLFHDVGNVIDRDRHHIISEETIQRLTASGKLPFSTREAEIVGLLCRWHRKEYDPQRVDEIHNETVRTGLMASILRVADAMDIDHKRSDYNERFSEVLEFFYPLEMPFWTSLEEILGVRIQCRPGVNLQVLASRELRDNMQFNMLRTDLERTPLPWTVEQVAVSNKKAGKNHSPRENSTAGSTPGPQKAILTFPFDCHSLIMAAISRRNLKQAGYQVELLCFPDTADASGWLWREALAEVKPEKYGALVVIGDRPDPGVTSDVLTRAKLWGAAGVSITLLNRHEANWSRLPQLLELGVETFLGGDWAYFWGSNVQPSDLAWGQIAALCTRDPTQSTMSYSPEHETIVQGLLKSVYDRAAGSTNDVDGWARLAEGIIGRIEANDHAYFAAQAAGFVARYATPPPPTAVDGRVIHFTEPPGDLPQAYYWALEAAIEKIGRAPERGIQFKAPYALASWTDGGEVELLAISHWREEAAIPIRLLYPNDLGPQPEGNESSIRVRIPGAQAEKVIGALNAACNAGQDLR